MLTGRASHLPIDGILPSSAGALHTAKSRLHMNLFPIGYAGVNSVGIEVNPDFPASVRETRVEEAIHRALISVSLLVHNKGRVISLP